ncbi:unnamed protein product [Ambrosiozyma monospora]|uniref:Unnamed protein product n=1 Tax=Ambrosiozyma monospora TaxID=43982 RepID=A0ACB5U9Z9_AMBMO|nr:unnamed protein product [Ambrosiozyma monospora]
MTILPLTNQHDVIFEERYKPEILTKLSHRTTNGKSKIPLYKLSKEQDSVFKIIENTIKYKESKSCLILGSRGVGKTTMLSNSLIDIENQYANQYITIKLNGGFQDDDGSAIREIARQLDWFLMSHGLTQEIMLEVGTASGIMARIMKVIDPSLNDEDDENIDKDGWKDLMKAIKLLRRYAIVIIIDEFEKFTGNSKQTLLYNLFDVAQSSNSVSLKEDELGFKSAICVIGVTCKTTVREQLEKRVKSRFSQRIIQINKVKTLDEFCELCFHLLKIDSTGNDKVEKQILER